MIHLINGKILLSGATILAAAALVVGGTLAFFSDSETSTGNTFTAGELDLQIDAEAHYAGLVCSDVDPGGSVVLQWVDDPNDPIPTTRPDLLGSSCEGTWQLKDLVSGSGGDRFFALNDIKPGDTGENTVSIHVFDNDAWGWFEVNPTLDNGELQEALLFSVWLDQGSIPGFQCPDDAAPCTSDSSEGDNIFNTGDAPLGTPGPIDAGGEEYALGSILAGVRSGLGSACNGAGNDPDGDGVTPGDTGACQGLPTDGHLVGSTTYYFGVGWELPSGTGNEVQNDSFVATMDFQAVQYRNNPVPTFPVAP